MPVPTPHFVHRLNALKGWPHPFALDYRALPGIVDNQKVEVVRGRCYHLGPDGKLYPGVTGHQMGLFALVGSKAFDTDTDSGYNPNNPDDYNGPGAYYPVTPSGHIVCLVAKGGYELETTEFDDDQSPYNPNDLLRADSNGILTKDGVTPGYASSTDSTAVVGVVSRPGPYKNALGNKVIAFWPVWYPGAQ
jgi:hypothetical protein